REAGERVGVLGGLEIDVLADRDRGTRAEEGLDVARDVEAGLAGELAHGVVPGKATAEEVGHPVEVAVQPALREGDARGGGGVGVAALHARAAGGSGEVRQLPRASVAGHRELETVTGEAQ